MASKGLVLVTGLNGYIAARTAEALLNAGYSVRGTVRSLPSADAILATLAPSPHGDRLSVVAVPDITAPNAFDEAVKGVSSIAHLAAPVSLRFTDPEPVLKGAVQGTLTLLESAAREQSVKNVVLMSSIAAVASANKETPYTFTEKDWNEVSEKIVREEGKAAHPGHIYSASKTASEKAFWKFREERKPAFRMSAVNPVFVAGPPLVAPSTASQLGDTYSWVFQLLSGAKIPTVFPGLYAGFVDVRDVARVVVFNIGHAEATDGERYLVSAAYGPMQAAADVLRKAYPDRRDVIDEGTPGEGYLPGYAFPEEKVYDGSKVVRTTGQGYIPFDKTVVDTAKALEHLL